MLIFSIIVQLILLGICAFHLWKDHYEGGKDFQLPQNEEVTLFIKRDGKWLFHSKRPVGHPDIEEVLKTPGMAILQSGKVTEGKNG
jgi:hypothetical protein